MKANELRIGNYIKNGNAYETKVTIDILNDLSAFDPIPLNKEWLEKFGFEKVNEISEYFDGEDMYCCEYIKPIVKTPTGNDDYIIINNNMKGHYKHIKNVHQLQNLYFALTGNELTTNND